jgi:hypothetical protein
VLLALVASALVVFGSPYVGQLRAAVQSTFPEQYRTIIGGVVAVVVLVAVLSALAGVRRWRKDPSNWDRARRDKSWVRYALIAVAVAIAGAFARFVSTGNIDVDLVEAFHFVEYGAITYLYYRVWRRRPDTGAVVFPAAAAFLVGIADESVQWLVPGRIGELHDIWLNGVAVGCGVLVSVAIHPPLSLRLSHHRSARFAVAAMVCLVVVALAAFVDQVHLGFEIDDGQAVFRSQFDTRALAAAAADRAVRWRTSPPPTGGFAREDRYLSEGQWHVQQRNAAEAARDWWTAWSENRILERFFAPVLDGGSRWPPEQLSRIEAHARGDRGPFVSVASPYPIFVISRPTLWLATALLAMAILIACRGRTSRPRVFVP